MRDFVYLSRDNPYHFYRQFSKVGGHYKIIRDDFKEGFIMCELFDTVYFKMELKYDEMKCVLYHLTRIYKPELKSMIELLYANVRSKPYRGGLYNDKGQETKNVKLLLKRIM